MNLPGLGNLGNYSQFIMIGLILVVFYFLLIRPQQKAEKKRKLMIDELKNGDKVITNAGIFGVVVGKKDDDNKIIIRIADNTKVEFAKSAVSRKLD